VIGIKVTLLWSKCKLAGQTLLATIRPVVFRRSRSAKQGTAAAVIPNLFLEMP
jgi:hypothetical protein